jgi:hypothetical protein
MTCIQKGAFKKYSHNPNARVTQNYSVVEDLSQTPCVMSALEELQSFPSQRKAMLSSLGSIKSYNTGMIILDTNDFETLSPLPCCVSNSSGSPHEIFHSEYLSYIV